MVSSLSSSPPSHCFLKLNSPNLFTQQLTISVKMDALNMQHVLATSNVVVTRGGLVKMIAALVSLFIFYLAVPLFLVPSF